jgi:4'-phosphopantetheinyl transferase
MPPVWPALAEDEVHLWRAVLDVPEGWIGKLSEVLSADERGRAERIEPDRGRARFVTGRHVLRTILGSYLGLAPERVEFTYELQGKPGVAREQNRSRLSFSLAHSRDRMLVAVTQRRSVGVDVEFVRPLFDATGIAECVFSAREQAALGALAPSEQLAGFFHGWTRKEAWLKAASAGPGWPPDSFSVSLGPGTPCRLLEVQGDPEAPEHWSLTSFEPAPGYVGALAVEGWGWTVVCYDDSLEDRAQGTGLNEVPLAIRDHGIE